MAGLENLWLSIGRAREYLEQEHNWKVTRQTINNWVKKGKNGNQLQSEKWHGQWVTRRDWIDTFVANA